MKISKSKKYETRMSIICFILLIILIIIMAIIQEVRAVEVVAYKNYTVKTGETVWSIANKLDLNEDLNKTIYNIRKDNNIVDCGKLAEGQVIKIREVK